MVNGTLVTHTYNRHTSGHQDHQGHQVDQDHQDYQGYQVDHNHLIIKAMR